MLYPEEKKIKLLLKYKKHAKTAAFNGKVAFMLLLQKTNVIAHKLELFKKVSRKGFLQASGNPVRKRNAYKIKVMILKSAIKGYHEFHVRLHKDLEMLISAAPILLLTRVIF